jgi:hypothetical protein
MARLSRHDYVPNRDDFRVQETLQTGQSRIETEQQSGRRNPRVRDVAYSKW